LACSRPEVVLTAVQEKGQPSLEQEKYVELNENKSPSPKSISLLEDIEGYLPWNFVLTSEKLATKELLFALLCNPKNLIK
jgi:hypothetical protein